METSPANSMTNDHAELGSRCKHNHLNSVYLWKRVPRSAHGRSHSLSKTTIEGNVSHKPEPIHRMLAWVESALSPGRGCRPYPLAGSSATPAGSPTPLHPCPLAAILPT